MTCKHSYFKILTLLIIALTQSAFHRVTAQQSNNNIDDLFKVSKGTMYTSLTFSLDAKDAENEDQLLREVIDQSRLNYQFTINGGYAIKDNFTLGLSLGYGKMKDDITFSIDNEDEITTREIEQGVTIAPTMRNYIPI